MKELILDISHSLDEYRDDNRIEFSKKSYPTEMHVIGVTIPNLRIVLKQLRKQIIDLPPGERLQLCKHLTDEDVLELQLLAYELIRVDKELHSLLTANEIVRLGIKLDNWLSTDSYAMYVVGLAWANQMISIATINDFIKSQDNWKRRVALVATTTLNQVANGDTKQTLDICLFAVGDHVDMITKALSWALRVLSKYDKEAVLEFLEEHKAVLSKRVLREVGNKINLGKKNLN